VNDGHIVVVSNLKTMSLNHGTAPERRPLR
jgi:hypothetical protein